MSLASLIGPRTPQTRTLVCYHCGRAFVAAARAITLTCPTCHKRVHVNDIVVAHSLHARTLQTCGRLVVEKKGRVFAGSVLAAQGVEVWGSLEGNVSTAGKVTIGPRGRWRGDLVARLLIVHSGAVIEGGHFAVNIPQTGGTAGSNDGRGDGLVCLMDHGAEPHERRLAAALH